MKLSVVVCTYNRADLLNECLVSLMQQSLSPAAFEIVVVDNNSRDDTKEKVTAFANRRPNVRLVTEMQQGHSHARNRGFRESSGEYVAYLDDDCLADPVWAESILKAFMEKAIQPDAVGGRIIPRYPVQPPKWYDTEIDTRSWGTTADYISGNALKHGFSGANMAFPRLLLEQVGGFSTRFGIVDGVLRMGEDTELFARLLAKGHQRFWYDPMILVQHWTPEENFSLSKRLHKAFFCGRSHGNIDNRKPSVFALLGLAGSVVFHTCSVPVTSLQSKSKRQRSPQRCLINAAHQFGLLMESMAYWLEKGR